jgi:Cu+-exporting ATPase
MTQNSIHPISKLIKEFILSNKNFKEKDIILDNFEELQGKGLIAKYENNIYKIGSKKWLTENVTTNSNDNNTNNFNSEKGVFISINDNIIGKYDIISNFREGIADLLKNLIKTYKVIILSGDTDKDKSELDRITDGLISQGKIEAYFEYTPDKKAKFIEELNAQGKKTMMFGDGLNDSMALNSSEIGVAVTESNSNFTPGADIILLGNKLNNLDKILNLAHKTKLTIYLSFGLSFLYNLVGLYYGLQGKLTPLFAAIFMPISSITVVIFNVLLITYFARKNKFL